MWTAWLAQLNSPYGDGYESTQSCCCGRSAMVMSCRDSSEVTESYRGGEVLVVELPGAAVLGAIVFNAVMFGAAVLEL